MYGDFLCSIGELGKAEEMLKKSIDISPDDDYIKYFNLAQILDGEQSLFYWKRGIKLLFLLINKLETNDSMGNDSIIEQLKFMKNQLCSAYCAISELFMTDLCDLEEAETEIQKYLSKATEINDSHFETLCCKLSYFKTISDFDNCDLVISKIKDILLYKFKLGGDNFDSAYSQNENESQLPEYSVRVNLSRTLIDLNETEFAELILNTLLNEDEEDWQVWYLLSWCYLVSNDVTGAIESLEMFEKYGKKHIKEPEVEKQFISDLENLRFNIEKKKNH
ncbi:putative assembly chaperone of rpl4 [Cryptosporidium felis]|nr:putative assembly chaperone of rpl4 [Cryptosporidium felis]